MNRIITFLFFFIPLFSLAQKKPLDHTVYDGWQSIGERMISNDGKWVLYTVTPQEGDAILYIKSTAGNDYKMEVPRGYNATLTEDSRFAVFKIKPKYKETRDARIKKKRPEDLPKDSFGVVALGKDTIYKIAKVRTYKTPQKASGWVAYLKEKETAATKQNTPTQKTVDSLKRTIDSLVLLVKEIKNVKGGNRDGKDAEDDPIGGGGSNEGSDLVLRHLGTGKERVFKNVADYYFNTYGQKLLMKITRSSRDSLSQNGVLMYDLLTSTLDTISKGGNDFKSFALSEDGARAAFVAERDTAKSLQKFYQLFVYEDGKDSANLLLDKTSEGMQLGLTVSENGAVTFSKSGNRLFFGTAPIAPPKDTTLVDFELAKLDVWHYNDDYLQTQQLSNLQNELKRTYLAVYDFSTGQMRQLGSKELQNVYQTAEGDGAVFYAVSDTGRRVASQWSGQTKKDIYAINVTSGENTLIKKNHDGSIYPSGTGKYLLLYDSKAKNYFVWDGKGIKNSTSKIKVPLYNEENDVPDDPGPYGVMGWSEADSFVYVYDRYDVWKVDPTNVLPPKIFVSGRAQKNSFRYVRVDPEERFIKASKPLFFKLQNQTSKMTNVYFRNPSGKMERWLTPFSTYTYNVFQKAKDASSFIYTRENYSNSPDLFFVRAGTTDLEKVKNEEVRITQLSYINPQQADYNWGTAELYHWKTFSGQQSSGILYKPEDFDPSKKYPMLIYFYEKLSDGLYNYSPPSPTPSRLNIPFFVSRGYLVFAPDISYTKGNPGKDAYNYIVSGAQALAKNKWVDAKNIGIQGQSWGGYQVAYLITATNMFKAAWAGAPVVNMTSAYGGIRWESGNNRQSQYEKGQSRIGASLWERPDLYIANSPLFHLPKVQTPLVIMANDADGAVPWYQGIEFFTAMRRLNKKVWLLSYNGEAHNLVERRNRKDIQIREQEFFDWMLKGEKPAKWLVDGVPAIKKGKEWGLETVD